MAWTAPMTATAGSLWTAAQWNTHVRDNLLETMPGKATTAGRWFVSSAANAIAERAISSATVATAETETGTSYGDVTTVGPAVTITTGTRAMVFTNARVSNSTANANSAFSYAVSSATTISASDEWSTSLDGTTASDLNRMGGAHFVTNLTAGSNIFTMKYKVSAGTATFADRHIIVMAF